MLIPHPARSYQYAPSFRGRIQAEDLDIELRTNELGLRDQPIQRKGGSEALVLALGDSFTFGFGLEAEEAWPARLDERLHASGWRGDVLNAGVSGYGPWQIRLLLEELVHRLTPDVVILGLWPPTATRIEDPYVYLHGYAVVSSAVPHIRVVDDGFLYSRWPRGWKRSVDHWLKEHLHVGAYLLQATAKARRKLVDRANAALPPASASPRPEDQMEPLLAELARIHEITAAAGATLVVLLITPQNEDGTFEQGHEARNRAVSDFCRTRSIPLVDSLPLFEAQSPGEARFRRSQSDFHWSSEAQDLAAAELARALHGEGLLSGQEATLE